MRNFVGQRFVDKSRLKDNGVSSNFIWISKQLNIFQEFFMFIQSTLVLVLYNDWKDFSWFSIDMASSTRVVATWMVGMYSAVFSFSGTDRGRCRNDKISTYWNFIDRNENGDCIVFNDIWAYDAM